jgi:hypothetical protein
MIPDWAMLDLFTCTNEPFAGRININAFVNAGIGSTAASQHQNALSALLYNTGAGAVAVGNILGLGFTSYTPPASYPNVFSMVGQVCEVGSMTLGGHKVVNEQAIRAIADLINVRSDTFTIWVRAQATPYGNDVVCGEARLQTVVQRDSTTGKWRILYQRWM